MHRSPTILTTSVPPRYSDEYPTHPSHVSDSDVSEPTLVLSSALIADGYSMVRGAHGRSTQNSNLRAAHPIADVCQR
jgi:hypothetical protein